MPPDFCDSADHICFSTSRIFALLLVALPLVVAVLVWLYAAFCVKTLKEQAGSQPDTEGGDGHAQNPGDTRSLLQQITEVDQTLREEEICVVLSCYAESEDELRHSISTVAGLPLGSTSTRLMIFVDGLQDFCSEEVAGCINTLSHDQVADNLPSAFDTLRVLGKLLPIEHAERKHGCTCFTGVVTADAQKHLGVEMERSQWVPFEIFVKGPSVRRSKRASQALFLSLLKRDISRGHAGPSGILFLDGDTKVMHVTEMHRQLCLQGLGGCGPFLQPFNVQSPVLAQQMVDYYTQCFLWSGLSLFRFVFPLNGSCAMYSREALLTVADEYCCEICPDSLWQSMSIEMGEDSYLSNLLHKAGYGICVLPNVHASAFMPETILEYVAQQRRWKVSFLGNRTQLLLDLSSWRGCRCVIWPLFVMTFPCQPYLGIGLATILFTSSVGHVLKFFGAYSFSIGAVVYIACWLCISLYAMLSAGKDVKSQPVMHQYATKCLLGANLFTFLTAFFLSRLYASAMYWACIVVSAVIFLMVMLPHGMRDPWKALCLPLRQFGAFVEMVQTPLLAMATLEGTKNGWGTRISVDSAAEKQQTSIHAVIRLWKRRSLMSLWLAVNFASGGVLISFRMTDAVLHVLPYFLILPLLVFSVSAVIYSWWLFGIKSKLDKDNCDRVAAYDPLLDSSDEQRMDKCDKIPAYDPLLDSLDEQCMGA